MNTKRQISQKEKFSVAVFLNKSFSDKQKRQFITLTRQRERCLNETFQTIRVPKWLMETDILL